MRHAPCRTRKRLFSPESFSQPGGRGSSARAEIRSTTRRRIFWTPMDSISLAADGLRRRLYFATTLQRCDEITKIKIRFCRTFIKRSQVLGIFPKSMSDSFIDHVRNRTVGRSSLQLQRSVNLGFKIDGSSANFTHTAIMTSKRFNVNTPSGSAGISFTFSGSLDVYGFRPAFQY